MSDEIVDYWHGGKPGLKPGDLLVPPGSQSGTARDLTNAAISSNPALQAQYPADQQRVHVTHDQRFARVFAARCRDAELKPGDLYQVEPIGPLESDPDSTAIAGINWACAQARIMAAVERRVQMTEREINRATAPYTAWVDGTPAYSNDGWALPSPRQRAAGITAADMRILGR